MVRYKVEDYVCRCKCNQMMAHWKNDMLEKLPLQCVYILFDASGRAVYAGSTKNIVYRLLVHLKRFGNAIEEFEIIETEGNLLELEKQTIEKYKPMANTFGVKTHFGSTEERRSCPLIRPR